MFSGVPEQGNVVNVDVARLSCYLCFVSTIASWTHAPLHFVFQMDVNGERITHCLHPL